jgi:hypothetical protein
MPAPVAAVAILIVMPSTIMIPISIPLVMSSTIMILISIPIAATTVDAEAAHYAAGDSLAWIFLRPARQRQRTGRQRDSAGGGK